MAATAALFANQAEFEFQVGPHAIGDLKVVGFEADVGFMCAPGYLWLAERTPPSVELVGAACVFDDPRNAGRPVYFSDLIVPEDSPAD